MAVEILRDCRMFAGGADLTVQSNRFEIEAETEDKEATTFGSNGWREVLGANKGGGFKGGGHWQAGDLAKVDDEAWASLGALGAYSAFKTTAGAGDLAWLVKGLSSKYQFLGDQGEIAPYMLEVSSSWPMVRGKGLHPPGTARTATGTGTAVEHVAVGASEYVYAAVHVLSISGTDTPTITFKLQSDDGSGFASATDRITFDAQTALGGQILRAAGAITDTFWRLQWTISGTNPSFLFVATFGVA